MLQGGGISPLAAEREPDQSGVIWTPGLGLGDPRGGVLPANSVGI
jgi:hypothetical protein